jgi:hypothetical protein
MITHFNKAKNGVMLFLSERPFNIHLHWAHHSTTLDNVQNVLQMQSILWPC